LTEITISGSIENMRKQFATSAEKATFRNNLFRAIIAAIPGATPIVRDEDDAIYGGVFGFTLAGEESVHLSYDEWKNRVRVSGNWPRSKLDGGTAFSPASYNSETTPSITCDADKAPDKIAADIVRRFLPDYRAMLAKCIERRDNHEAYIRNVNGLAAELAGIMGTRSRGDAYHGPTQRRADLPGSLGGYGHVECSSDSASFEIHSLPAAQARKLAAFLKTL
jgi:hypothetical protein